MRFQVCRRDNGHTVTDTNTGNVCQTLKRNKVESLCCFESSKLRSILGYMQDKPSSCGGNTVHSVCLAAELSYCTKQLCCQLMLKSLLVQWDGRWVPLLGSVGLAGSCPMVPVLPGMCQPPAAPCQGASQSLFSPPWGLREVPPPLVSCPPHTLFISETGTIRQKDEQVNSWE